MSVDPAHSLADAFDLGTALFHGKTGDPYPIEEKLAIHEVNIQKEIKRHWRENSPFMITGLRTTRNNHLEAQEISHLPPKEKLRAIVEAKQVPRRKTDDRM